MIYPNPTDMTSDTLSDLPQWWQITRNPFVLRYLRSNLRLPALISGAIVYGGSSIFFYLVSLGIAAKHAETPFMESAIFPFSIIFFLQLFILNFVGTGAVASGMARESIDGVLTYQRLLPISPATKIIGYLLGLPIRQYYYFLLTLPVTLLIIITGQIPVQIWLPLYLVLFTSTLMFYLLAMSVGFIMGKKFSAVISQGLVTLLYFVLPQLSNFGFVVFEYLTIRPTLFTAIQKVTDKVIHRRESALFYHWEVSHTAYCIVVQCLLSLIFFALLRRKWKSEDFHLLSKLQCVAITALVHIFVLGGIWVNTANGAIFDIELNGRGARYLVAQQAINQNEHLIAIGILGIYGMISFSIVILLQYIYTPHKYSYLAGLRKRLSEKSRFPSLFHDNASAVTTTLIITVISTTAWLIYAHHLLSTQYMQQIIGNASLRPTEILLICVAATPLIAHGLLLEHWGRKLTLTIAVFAWVIPLAIAILLSSWKFGGALPSIFYGLSPFTMNFAPGYLLLHTNQGHFLQGVWVGVAIYHLLSIYAFVKIIHRRHHFTHTVKTQQK